MNADKALQGLTRRERGCRYIMRTTSRKSPDWTVNQVRLLPCPAEKREEKGEKEGSGRSRTSALPRNFPFPLPSPLAAHSE